MRRIVRLARMRVGGWALVFVVNAACFCLLALPPPAARVHAQGVPQRQLAGGPVIGSPRAVGSIEASLDDSPQSPTIQALAPPGSLTLPPDGRAVLVWPGDTGNPTSGPREIFLANRSDQTSTIAADDTTLTITVPEGYLPVPDAPCSPGAARNVTTCPLAGLAFVTFDAADAAHPQPLPQQVSVGSGQSVALAAATGTPPGVAAVAVLYDPPGAPGAAGSGAGVTWDGASIVLSAPEGFKIAFAPYASYGDQGCTPNDELSTTVTCPATGVPPRLFHVSTLSLNALNLPPPTPRGVLAEIDSPTVHDEQATGRPVAFTARGSSDLAYIWQFGDGTIAVGQAVQHSYATPGFYTASLTVVITGIGAGFGQTTQTRLVSVGQPPVTVTYPAGWNLIGLPADTQLNGVSGPLYTNFPCANEPPPPPPPTGPGGAPLPTVVPEQSCASGYRQVPPDRPPEAGVGYWAYFTRPTTVTLPFEDDQTGFSSQPGRFIMIGNPTFEPAVARGADVVYVYDPPCCSYRQTDTLQPGQGAWAYSATGAPISIYVKPPEPPPCVQSQPGPSPAWNQLCPASSPSPRGQARLVFDPAQHNAVLFGGYNFQREQTLSDTWTWNGTSWTEQQPASSPSQRGWPAMAYDDALGEIVLFGGAGVSSPFASFDETWTWDGATWTQQHPARSPTPRYNAAMAYDAARGDLVLFGGLGAGGANGGYLNDTWTFDGTTWTPVCGADDTPACAPPPGLGNAMAYDPVHQQIVMFGGSNGDNYTWTWDGSGWTQQQPAQSPPAAQFGTLTFDPLVNAVLFVGSALPDLGTSGNQVWARDGATWTQLLPSGSLPPRHDAAVAFGPNSRGVLLFGGGAPLSEALADLNDTWVLR